MTRNKMVDALKPIGKLSVKERLALVRSQEKLDDEAMVRLAERKSDFRGPLFTIVEVLSKRANFTPSYYYWPKKIQKKFGRHVDRAYDIVAEPVFDWTSELEESYHPVGSFTFVELYFLVTLNDRYSNFEKVMFAFDKTTWIMLAITFMSTFSGIFFINLMPRRVRRVFYGTGIV
jgi:hypothetical protein